MASQKKQQLKGILKSSSSFDKGETDPRKNTKWDEMNILATLHPPDKDYGHDKIEEPKTPYHHMEEDSDRADGYRSGGEQVLDPESLAAKLVESSCPKVMEVTEEEQEESEEESEPENTEDRQRRLSFEQKRKIHYNEFQAVKLARQLMDSESEEDDEEEEGAGAVDKEPMSMENSQGPLALQAEESGSSASK